MERSNCQILYWPKDGACGHSVTVEVSEEFIEFARKQEIDKKKYEKIGLGIIRACGWEKFGKRDISHEGGICHWEEDSGLLHHICIPGNAAGVALEKMAHEWAYRPHNMHYMSQAAAVLGIMSFYLKDIEIRIPRKTEAESKSQQT